jgi:hypothetical protein
VIRLKAPIDQSIICVDFQSILLALAGIETADQSRHLQPTNPTDLASSP